MHPTTTLSAHLLLSLAITVALMACSGGSASAQKDLEIPEAVLATLAQKYPDAEDLDWEQDRNDSYEAQFKIRGQKVRADFNADGTWIETEESVKWKELPEAVQDAIKAEFDKDDIVELEHTVNAEKGEFYDIELDPKGEKKFDVEYRADGTRM